MMGAAITTFRRTGKKLQTLMLGMAIFCLSSLVQAGTIVEVQTPFGDFQIELYDDTAPNTVINFLNYVSSGSYDGTFIHRSPGFVIQGGGWYLDESQNTFLRISTNGTIPNEFGASNIRGTVAMAKGSDPDSATSQWFVNTQDNSYLDSPTNGSFTVFGEVIGNGMQIVDSIAAIGIGSVTGLSESIPIVNYTSGPVLNSNLVTVNMFVVEEEIPPPNTFNAISGELDITLDAGEYGFATLSLSVVSTEPEVLVQIELDSIVVISESVDKMATFKASTGQLVLPELVVAGEVAYGNLVFLLTDADQYIFTLQSFE